MILTLLSGVLVFRSWGWILNVIPSVLAFWFYRIALTDTNFGLLTFHVGFFILFVVLFLLNLILLRPWRDNRWTAVPVLVIFCFGLSLGAGMILSGLEYWYGTPPLRWIRWVLPFVVAAAGLIFEYVRRRKGAGVSGTSAGAIEAEIH